MRNNANIYLQKAAEELLGGFAEVLPDGLGELASAEGVSGLGIDKLLYEVFSSASDGVGTVVELFLFLVGTGLIGSLAFGRTSRLAVGAASSVISFGALLWLYPAFTCAFDALGDLSRFFGALVPVVSAIPILGGGTSTGATVGFGMELALWLMGGVCGELLPLIVAAMLATSGFNFGTGTGAGFKSLFTKLIGVCTAVLAGMTALQTFISACADSATMRLAKYAASDMIPVVGGAVSGALSTLAGGLSYAGGIIGAGSVFAMLSIALSPLVMLLLYRLAFAVAGGICRCVSGGVSCISGISDALDAVISVYVMTMIIYIFDIITVIIGGVRIIG